MTVDAPEAADSYLGQMGLSFARIDGSFVGELDVSPALCSSPGFVRVGALAVLADCVAGYRAFVDFDGAWVATSALDVHGPFRATGGSLRAKAELASRRRTAAVYEVTVVDDAVGAGPVAMATVTLTLLGRQDGARDVDAAERVARATRPVARLRSLESVVRLVDPSPNDGLRMEVRGNVRNSWGALAGGVTSLLAELAAERTATDALGRPVVVRAMDVHFLAPGRTGPVDARAHLVAAGSSSAHLRVRLIDTGSDDRTIATVSAVAVAVG